MLSSAPSSSLYCHPNRRHVKLLRRPILQCRTATPDEEVACVPCCLVTYLHPSLVLPPPPGGARGLNRRSVNFRVSLPLQPPLLCAISSPTTPFANRPHSYLFIFFRSSLIAHSWHSFCSMRITHLASLLAVLQLAWPRQQRPTHGELRVQGILARHLIFARCYSSTM